MQAVLEGVGAPSNIIELHAGCGTLSFPLARLGKIHAVEGDPSATAMPKPPAAGSGRRANERREGDHRRGAVRSALLQCKFGVKKHGRGDQHVWPVPLSICNLPHGI